MGKLLFWVLVAIAIYLIWALVASNRRRAARRDAQPGGDGSGGGSRGASDPQRLETMMQCRVCGVHLPDSEAVFARGRVYCGDEHRDQDRE